MISREAQEAFYAGRRSERLPFVLNDSVVAVEGRKAGIGAAVISLDADDPEVKYTIEYGDDGSFEVVPARCLQPYKKKA